MTAAAGVLSSRRSKYATASCTGSGTSGEGTVATAVMSKMNVANNCASATRASGAAAGIVALVSDRRCRNIGRHTSPGGSVRTQGHSSTGGNAGGTPTTSKCTKPCADRRPRSQSKASVSPGGVGRHSTTDPCGSSNRRAPL